MDNTPGRPPTAGEHFGSLFWSYAIPVGVGGAIWHLLGHTAWAGYLGLAVGIAVYVGLMVASHLDKQKRQDRQLPRLP